MSIKIKKKYYLCTAKQTTEKMKSFLSMLLFLSLSSTFQASDFARGADVSWCSEMEASGKKFYNANGSETELMALMKQIGMNAIRLRVWVNPEQAYGAWCDKADVLAKAKRAHAQGLDLLIDFHYSDFFADPSRQTKPAAWSSFSTEQTKLAVADHTKDVLQALKAAGIEPRWVQVGNETRSGMVWDDGRLNWNLSGSALWKGYVALSNAGYEAVKAVFPQAQVIVHIDKGPEDNAWFFKSFKQYGGKFDVIGLSHYPESSWQSENSKTVANMQTLGTTFGVPVMIVETGYSASNETLAGQVMEDLFEKVKNVDACAGIFYWEPQLYGWWKPTYYTKLGWNAYGKGAFTSQGRPGAALAPFAGDEDGIGNLRSTMGNGQKTMYDLQGRRLSTPNLSVLPRLIIVGGRKVVIR